MASVGFIYCGLFALVTCGVDAARSGGRMGGGSSSSFGGFRVPNDPTDISQSTVDIQQTQQALNVQFGKLAAYRLNTLPDSVAAGARLAISAILAVAEETAQS
ncbi:hypothetical protein RRG08_058037 [Elysia crispata]|uniref:Uncharacterized protein n=1 Tax=Elysia crispata TaxID=231223 RepID=A0AAE1A7X7_9GAST|nr:hypothetical protein RRG08_058037 [Elysia crispata]